MKSALTGTILLIAVAMLLGWFGLPAPDSGAAQPSGHGHPDLPATRPVAQTDLADDEVSATESADAVLARTSLADTSVPGRLTVDDRGNLIISQETKAIMDYFLSLTGELHADDLRRLIQAWARQQGDDHSTDQFLLLFDQYQTYLRTVATGNFSAEGENAIRQNLALRQQFRQEIFGQAVASALFAEEDAYDQFSAARMDVMQSAMDDADKAQALRSLYLTLPPDIAVQYQQQHQLATLREQEARLRDNGGDAAVFAHRQQQFGDVGALRFQVLDEERRQWQARIDQYRQARQRILDASLAPADQQQQIKVLRRELFSEPEQLRVAALDRMASTPD